MRIRTVGALFIAAGLGVLPSLAPAHAEDDPAAADGVFLTPFREDGADYNAAANLFEKSPERADSRDDTGCTDPDENGHRDCLPAGASENVLANGQVLYWNAIEGSEDLSETQAVVPHGGDVARNDQSRVLTIDWAKGTGAAWDTPANATASPDEEHGDPTPPTEPPLIPGTSNDNGPLSDGSLFCSDQKQLLDGTILAAGGTNYYAEPRVDDSTGVIELEGARNARIFDPATGDWRQTGSMGQGRWYPSMVTLGDGKVFVASGVTKLIKPLYPWRAVNQDDPAATTADDLARLQESGDNVEQTETYDPNSGTWSDNGENAKRALPLFPRLHLLPNGHVYYDAAGQAFNPMGQSYKQALWNEAASYDPIAGTWTDLGVPGLDNPVDPATGNYAEPGFRGSTFNQALPYRPENGYQRATFLTAGGVQLMSPGSYKPTDTTRLSEVAIAADGTETLSTTPAGKLGRPRWYSSAVTLPTGQVLALSGADVDEVVSPGHESPIRQAELFTPTFDAASGRYTGGSWEDVAVAKRRRTYHNNAVLLPDGRVLVGGHSPIPNSYYRVMSDPDAAPEVREASNNYKDASFEIYEPPYLHWGVKRPVIDTMNNRVNTGQTLLVPTRDAADIVSVVLVRNPSETHLIDGDQRVVELEIQTKQGSAVQVKVPDSANVLPPGPYMLFVNKRAGADPADTRQVPSVATQVFVDTPVPGWAVDPATYPSASPSENGGHGNGGGTASTTSTTETTVPASSDTTLVSVPELGLAARPVASDRPRPAGALALACALAAVGGLALMAGRRARPRPVRPVRIDE